jgi:hypothetical protein
MAINVLGNGLSQSKHYADALSVQEAELHTRRRLGYPETVILAVQTNLANTYFGLDRFEDAIQIERDVYSGQLKLKGEEHIETLRAACNYAKSLIDLQRFKEAKPLMRKSIPVTRRILGDIHEITLKMRWFYAEALYRAEDATLDDLREAVTTLEETERIARRVLGGAHPLAAEIEGDLQDARGVLELRTKID